MTNPTRKPPAPEPPSTTIIQLCPADTAAWHNLISFQDALITLARGLAPLIIKSADRKILYRTTEANPVRSGLTLSVSFPEPGTDPDAP